MFLNTINKYLFIIIFLTILNVQHTNTLRLKLTQLKCNVTDKSFSKFQICRIKAESRSLQYLTIYIKFFQLPIEDINVRFRFMKKANGYKPFLYDFIAKCDFLKRLNPVVKMVWGWFKGVSNLNHSCPLTEDFEIKRLENQFMEEQLRSLPLMNGDYALIVNFGVKNSTKFNIEFYVTIF
ncbi:hypothetical protein FF38_02663 [Lucilia cuprina]|uniref:MD-2-related lipid-recognition domain-containing protein n=1 Tax=Lucilia cuprina TaxID=7375 RepID=A0A0L0C6Y5_LUCCU|nr:hypothetical protein FF38_02663 [Lucilia cuprina]